MAKKYPNIATYYKSKGTPIYRDTTSLLFDNGGKVKKRDKRKEINKRLDQWAEYASNYKWDSEGNPIRLSDELRNWYDSLVDYYDPTIYPGDTRQEIKITHKPKSLADRRKYKQFIKNAMDDIYKVSDQEYLYKNSPRSRYNIATGFRKKIYDPTLEPETSDWLTQYETQDITNNPSLKEKWKQRRNRAKIMNHVLAELRGYGELPSGYNDEDWANYIEHFNKTVNDAKNKLKYEQAKKDLKRKKGRYGGSDRTRLFLDDYKNNNWIQYDPNAVQEELPGLWSMQDKLNTEEKRQSFTNLLRTIPELAMTAPIERVIAEPHKTSIDVVNTATDIAMLPYYGLNDGINPISYDYEKEGFGQSYGSGIPGTIDASIFAITANPFIKPLYGGYQRYLNSLAPSDDLIQMGFNPFKRRSTVSKSPKTPKVEITPQQAEKLKKLNFTDEQIENFGTYFPEADSAFVDDFIKSEEAIKSTTAKAKKGTPTDVPEEINYNSSIDEIKQSTPIEVNESTPIEEIIADSSTSNTYFQGLGEIEVQQAAVKKHKEAYLNKIIKAHPEVSPEKIKQAFYDLRGETLEGIPIPLKKMGKPSLLERQAIHKKDPELKFLIEEPKDAKASDIVLPYENKSIYADYTLENPDLFPRNKKYYTSERAQEELGDVIEVIDEVTGMTTGEGKIPLNSREEMLTKHFTHGYYVPMNSPLNFKIFKQMQDDFNKLITKKGNQLAEPKTVTRSDRDFEIKNLNKSFSDLSEGDVITHPKFVSTRIGPDLSMYPHDASGTFGNQTSLIKLPTGQSLYVPAKHKAGQHYIRELEGVLPQDLKMKVDKVNTPFEQGLREIDDITKQNLYLGSQEYLPSPNIKKYDAEGRKFKYFMFNNEAFPFEVNPDKLKDVLTPGTTSRDFFLRKSKIPFSNKYYFIDKPTFAGRQDWLNRLKSKYKSTKVPATKTEVFEFLKEYNKFKQTFPEKAKFEFSILNPYKRGGYLNNYYVQYNR